MDEVLASVIQLYYLTEFEKKKTKIETIIIDTFFIFSNNPVTGGLPNNPKKGQEEKRMSWTLKI